MEIQSRHILLGPHKLPGIRVSSVSVAHVRGRSPRLAAGIAPLVAGGVAVLSLVAAAGSGAQSRAQGLRAQDTALAAQARSAVLELYSLESAIARARADVAAAEAEVAALRHRQETVLLQLTVARRTFVIAERRLGERLRDLYENGSSNPVAVLLGAESLDQALSTLDGLHRFASQDRSVIRQARSARAKLRALSRRLAARANELAREQERAAAEVAALERASAARQAYLTALSHRRAMTARRIRGVEAAAHAARVRSARIVPSEPAAAAPVLAPVADPITGGRTLTVIATGYVLKGTTATGIATSWGVVAVDPAVIPLGTRMTIPGYGEGIAADVGSAIQGAMIDLWFPTEAQALAWGRRTVTITLR